MKILSKLLKLVLVVGSVLGFFLGTGILMGCYYDTLYGKDAIYYTINNSFIFQVIAFLAFFACMLYYWSKNGVMSFGYGSEGEKSTLPPKQKWIRTGIAVVLLIAVNLIMPNWYTRVTTEGVEKHSYLGKTIRYTWSDVDYYMLDDHFDGMLSMKLVMKDKKCIDLQMRFLSLTSERFDELYTEEEFLLWLNQVLVKDGKELKIEDKELTAKNQKQLMRKLDEYWEELAQQLIEEYKKGTPG